MRTFFIVISYLSEIELSEAKKTIAQILHENRTFVLIMLGVPVFGMAIAFGIIFWKQPDNMVQVLAVIFFLAVQYVLMMFFWSKRVELLAKNDGEKQEELTSENIQNVEEYSEGKGVLKPEEERVFPTEDEQ